jgi:hypothetical protein
MSILFKVLVVLACALFLLQVASLADARGSDAMGVSMARSFGVLIAIALWAVLAGLLLTARTRGPFPSFGGWAALVLVPTSLGAAVTMLAGLSHRTPWWLHLTPLATPFLMGFYALALWMPAWRPVIEAPRANLAVWGLILGLSVLPVPGWLLARH